MINRTGIFVALAGSLGGCATRLEVAEAEAGNPASRQGIAYFLPFTQFDTKVSWVVTGCGAQGPELAVKTEATPKTARDPEHLYTIDYSSLDAWTKTSSVKVDFYDSGAIKAINAAADDRTAEIATKLISAVGKIAQFGAITSGGKSFAPTCSKLVTDALIDVSIHKAEVDRLGKLLEQENLVLQAQSARVTRGGDAASPDALRIYDQMIANVVARQIELDIAKRQLAGTMKKLTHVEELAFPASSAIFKTDQPLRVPLPVLKKWVANVALLGDNVPQQDAALTSLQKVKEVHLELETAGKWQQGTDFDPADKKARRAGIRYRVGIPGYLKSCTGAPCKGGIDKPTDPPARLPVVLLQRGTTFYLPFASEPFSHGALAATFSEAGVLTSAGYEQKRARGEAAAAVADALADQAVAVGTAFRDANLTKIKQKTDLAKAEKELEAAEKALLASPDPAALATEAFTADTAMKKAEVANIEAEIALTNARLLRDGIRAGQ